MREREQGPDNLYDVWRHRLPYPVSIAHKLAHSAPEPGARFALSLRMGQELLRFLALVALADGLAIPAPRSRVRDWLRALRQPGVGCFLHVLQSTTHFILNNRRKPFLQELTALVDEPVWEADVDHFKVLRNRYSHDDLHLAKAEAELRLAELDPLLRRLQEKTAFLSKYGLGILTSGSFRGGLHRYLWYPSRGVEETTDFVRLQVDRALPEDQVYLIDSSAKRALQLAPFFRYGAAGQSQLLFLDRLGPDGSWNLGVYRHPVRQAHVTEQLLSAQDSERELAVGSFLDAPDHWPQVVELCLNEASREKLLAAETPASPLDERFDLVGKLGTGASSEVLEVFDKVLERRCALKILIGEASRSLEARKRFKREGQILASLNHPRVVRVFHLDFDSEDRPFMLMELLEGEDLRKHLERSGRLEVAAALQVVDQVLEGLEVVHSAGVVHRDIKPANVLLSTTGARLVDFGVALPQAKPRLTVVGAKLGTEGYLAPEQRTGSASVRSDLFSVGSLLHTLLTGDPAPGAAYIGLVPQPLKPVLLRALAEDPGERYESATEFREILREVSARLSQPDPSSTSKPSNSEAIDRWIKAVLPHVWWQPNRVVSRPHVWAKKLSQDALQLGREIASSQSEALAQLRPLIHAQVPTQPSEHEDDPFGVYRFVRGPDGKEHEKQSVSLEGTQPVIALELSCAEAKTHDALLPLRALPSLVCLVVASGSLSDEVCEHLAQLPNLMALKIRGTNLTGTGLSLLGELPLLERLELDGTATRDSDLEAALPALPGLRMLSFGGPAATLETPTRHQITDRSVPCLLRLKKLQYLELHNCQVSEQGIARLREGLQMAEIVALNHS